VLVPMCGAGGELSVRGMFTLLRTHHRRLLVGVLATAAAAAVATPAVAGQSQTKTLRIYEKPTDVRLTTADGQPKEGPPAAGDILDAGGVLYRGDHRHQSRHAIGTDHTRCVFTGPDSGTCQGEAALGGSLILTRNSLTDDSFEIWYGTGRFQGITGSVTATTVSDERNDSDVVVRYKIG
jgi:hypothetical protein